MKPVFLLLAATLAAPLAHAHIKIDPATGPAGAYQKLTFQVGHGCAGSATNGITVVLPEGVTGAKPMPKAGWTIVAGDAAQRELSWKGGPLPDAQYDEFIMQVKLPAAMGKYTFKVIQACDKGRAEWSEAAGANAKFPAPTFDVVAPTEHVHQH